MSVRRLSRDRRLVRRVYLGVAAALVVIAAVRTFVVPPAVRTVQLKADHVVDPIEDSIAQNFAAAYLTISTAHPDQRDRALAPFGEASGWTVDLPQNKVVDRQVLGTQVAQVATRSDGSRIVVVQAQLTTGVTEYLAVRLQRTRAGEVQVVGAPALVGSPATTSAAESPAEQGTIDEPQIREVVTRSLRNLLAGNVEDLRADLTPDARVSVPPSPLKVVSLVDLQWTAVNESALATISAKDADGVSLTLSYELDLIHNAAGRWLIAAVHVPTT